jgi:hypothetical protein
VKGGMWRGEKKKMPKDNEIDELSAVIFFI